MSVPIATSPSATALREPAGHRLQLGLGKRRHGAALQDLLEEGPRGYQDRSGLPHRRGALLVQVGAMLDGVSVGHDARLAVAVGGDDTVGQYLLTSDRKSTR